MSWKRSALRLLVVVVALMTIAGTLGPVGATAASEGQPEPPHRFFGTVTDEGGDAVVGATVEIVYDGEVVEEAATDGNGYYDLQVADPESGEQVTIRVAGTDENAQYEWQSGGSTEHDFENVQDPTTPTTTTSTTPPTTTTTTPPSTTTTTSDDDDDDDDDSSWSPGGGTGGAPGGSDDGDGDSTTTSGGSDGSDGTTERGLQDPTTTEIVTAAPPTTATTQPETDETETTTETDETETTTEPGDDDDGLFGIGIPGFGIVPALVALVAAALLALRRGE